MSVCGERRTLPSHGDSRTICFVRRAWRPGRVGAAGEVRYLERGKQGRGNLFPLPVSPSPNGDIPTVQHMGRSWRNPGYGCSPDIASTAPARGGAGEERRRRGRGGGPVETYRYLLPQARAGWGTGRIVWISFAGGAGGVGAAGEVRYLERGRQGRGNSFPLPVSPTPNGDIPTVQHMGRSWRRAGHGGPPATPRVRLLT